MIEPVTKSNIEEVLPLIRAYQEFYQVSSISDAKNAQFFSQFLEPNPFGRLFAYREHQNLLGFATVYFSFASTITDKVAVLNDLYTKPECRGKGIGRKLINHARAFAVEQGAARLQWVTAPNNEQAQNLYVAMDTKKSTWHFYTYS